MAGLQGEHIVRYPEHSRDSKRKSKDAPAAAASSEWRCPSPESSPEASSCQPRPKQISIDTNLEAFAFPAQLDLHEREDRLCRRKNSPEVHPLDIQTAKLRAAFAYERAEAEAARTGFEERLKRVFLQVKQAAT